MEFIACIEIKMKLQIESITLVYKKVDHLRHKKKLTFLLSMWKSWKITTLRKKERLHKQAWKFIIKKVVKETQLNIMKTITQYKKNNFIFILSIV